MIITADHDCEYNMDGFAQYLASKENRNVKLFRYDNYKIFHDSYDNDDPTYMRAVQELKDQVINAKTDVIFERDFNYRYAKNHASVSILSNVYFSTKVLEAFPAIDEICFQPNFYGVIVRDDNIDGVTKVLEDCADFINCIGGKHFHYDKNFAPYFDIVKPRKDKLDTYDKFGNKYELGDLVIYGTYVTPIVGITDAKVMIGDGSMVSKESVTLVRKADGSHIKLGYFG